MISTIQENYEPSLKEKMKVLLKCPVSKGIVEHLLDMLEVRFDQSERLPLSSNLVQLLQQVNLATEDQILNLLKLQTDLCGREVFDQDFRCLAFNAKLSRGELVSNPTFDVLKHNRIADGEQ